MVDTVKFDPGIGEYVIDFNDYVNSVYSQLMHFKNMTQKRARFNLYASKIEEYMLNNISFYLGCLIWANYIVTENEKEPKRAGNQFSEGDLLDHDIGTPVVLLCPITSEVSDMELL